MARHVDALERYRPRTVSRFGTVKTRRPGLPVMSAPVTPPKPAPSSSSASRPISTSSKKSSVGSPQHNLRDDPRSLTRSDVDEIVAMLTGNLEKIAEHGRRADGIVKSMLEHSRGGSGECREVDLNGLVEEALNLAYHGARAQDQNFNITLERDFDRAVAPIELAPQEVTRVLLNLFGNGFHAATKHQHDGAEPNFRPVLRVMTHDLGDAVEIRIRDNGTGIPPEIRTSCFSRFLPPSRPAKGRGSVSRSAGTSSRSSMAARSRSTAGSASSPSSPCACRASAM
jgi:hypothetical protein